MGQMNKPDSKPNVSQIVENFINELKAMKKWWQSCDAAFQQYGTIQEYVNPKTKEYQQ